MTDSERVTQRQLFEQIKAMDDKMENRFESLINKIDGNYVTRREFEAELDSLKKLIYLLVGGVVTAGFTYFTVAGGING